jgi:hypothetical protein
MVTGGTRVAILAGLGVIGVVAALTYVRQNRGAARMGGRISRGKALWLGYALSLWFVICPALAFEPQLAAPFRIVLGTFGASMWARGLLELYLLYFRRGWKSSYGVAHDAFCLVVMVAQLAWLARPIAASLGTPLSSWALGLTAVVLVSLVLEIGYARTFYRIVEGRTTGKAGIWFASAHDPRFRSLVRATALANVPLYIFLVFFLVAVVGP